jgi:two-component system sensor histidine kinase SaeS
MSEHKYTPEEILQKLLVTEKQNKELRQELIRVEKEKTEYLQNVSHQLVAPLNAIKWHIENLTEQRISAERAKKVFRSIYSQATIAVHLAKNFNLMSNLEADQELNRMREPLQEINLKKLLVNLALDFQPLAWEKDIKIIVVDDDFDPKSNDVLAMLPLISQVFSNIIENAVKYADSGSTIKITGRYLSEIDSYAVSVSDKGIILRSDDSNKVFERGFRTQEGKNRYPPGTGFGLYIAKRIVDIHGGEIRVLSKDGITTFTVTLSVKKLEGKAKKRD